MSNNSMTGYKYADRWADFEGLEGRKISVHPSDIIGLEEALIGNQEVTVLISRFGFRFSVAHSINFVKERLADEKEKEEATSLAHWHAIDKCRSILRKMKEDELRRIEKEDAEYAEDKETEEPEKGE